MCGVGLNQLDLWGQKSSTVLTNRCHLSTLNSTLELAEVTALSCIVSHLCIFVPQQSVDLVLLSLSLETRNPNVHYFQFEERNFQKMSFNLCRFKFFLFSLFFCFFVLCFVWKFGSASRNFKRFKTFVPVAAFVLDGVQPT